MAIIKKAGFLQKGKIKNLIHFVGQNVFVPDLVHMPLYFMNSLMPLRLKFLREAYCALENRKIKGLIELEKERGNYAKLRITKLFLEKNSYEIGEQLINYALSKYCAYGANSFYIIFDEKLDEMARLFIQECKFRIASYETIFKIDKNALNNLDERGTDFLDFKHLKQSQFQKLSDMYNNAIMPDLRITFETNKNYFAESSTGGISKEVNFRYILENKEKDEICGYFNISSFDYKNYIIDVAISPFYENYFPDMIRFSVKQIEKRCKDSNLYVRIKHYFSTSNSLLSQSKEYDFEFITKNLIIVRDFFKPVKQDIFENAKILFNDISPIYRQ